MEYSQTLRYLYKIWSFQRGEPCKGFCEVQWPVCEVVNQPGLAYGKVFHFYQVIKLNKL